MSLIANPKKHVCNACGQRFKTEGGRRDHHRAKHSDPVSSGPSNSAGAQNVLASVTRLCYRGTAYSNLSATEQDTVRQRISGFCHPWKRLRKEGYDLPASANSQNDSNAANVRSSTQSEQSVAAIVLDCEMAGTFGGQSELIHITTIDFFSGNVLQNSLVNPSRPILDWRENITGINAARMQEAVARHEALDGWEAAREELRRFANKETIIIGQSVHHDLRVLRVLHAKIIDTAIMTTDAALGDMRKIRKRWGLQSLCHELLDIKIREPLQPGGHGVHDALEDVLATREVALLCIRNPEKLACWASAAREAFFRDNQGKQRKRGKKGKKGKKGMKDKQTGLQAGGRQGPRIGQRLFSPDSDEHEEVLRWEDVIDWEMWPKSPPDSD